MKTATENSIKLSKDTLAILKNYSHINSNILVKPGNVISTISPMMNILAKAEVPETFPVEFGIWDLSKLLGTISLFSDPSIVFEENRLIVRSGKSNVVYYYSEPSLLTIPTKEVKMPSSVLSFDLMEDEFAELSKASSVMQLPDLIISNNDGGSIDLTLTDRSDSSSNTYTINVDYKEETELSDYSFVFKYENLKVINGTYSVEISEKNVSKFTNHDTDITYWIALSSDSTCTK